MDKLEKVKKVFEEIVLKEVLEVIKDKNLSIDRRWRWYTEMGHVLPIDYSYHHPEAEGLNWNKITLYDDFYCDKYAFMTGESFVEICKDKNEDGSWDVNLNQLKEYFCDKAIYAFINDW